MESVRDLSKRDYRAAKSAAIRSLRMPNSGDNVTEALPSTDDVRTLSPSQYRQARTNIRRTLRDR
jgi:hypothetical protein